MILVRGRAVEPARHVLPGEDRDHARHGHGLVAADARMRACACGERSTLRCSSPAHGHIHGVARLAGDDRLGERIRQAGAAGVAGDVVLDFGHALQRVGDRAVAGAAAQIALERVRQVRALLVVERRRGHDHAGGAKAALERLRVEEGLLHRDAARRPGRGLRWW